jgi:hypothetical protein
MQMFAHLTPHQHIATAGIIAAEAARPTRTRAMGILSHFIDGEGLGRTTASARVRILMPS